jgi:hypothetical protein
MRVSRAIARLTILSLVLFGEPASTSPEHALVDYAARTMATKRSTSVLR